MKRQPLTRKMHPTLNPVLMHWAKLQQVSNPSPHTLKERDAIRKLANEMF